MFLYHMTLFSTCLGRALALSLPLVDPLVLVAANSPLSASNGSLLGATEPNCDSNFYGYNLNVASCKEAVGFMKDAYNARTYVQRNTPQTRGNFQSLPNPSLSSDGTCAVDVWLDRGATTEQIDQPQKIYDAANAILNKCVIGNPHRVGGEIISLGNSGRLSVKITQRTASGVHCGTSQPLPPSCQAVVDAMPVTYRKIQKYGPPGDAGVTVPLPWSLEKFDFLSGSCRVTLSATSPAQPRDQDVEWNIWAAAVAIGAMCWRRGQSGIATQLGVNGKLTLSFDQSYGSTLGSTSVGNLTEF